MNAPHPPPHAWSRLYTLLAIVVALFGLPSAIARARDLPRAARGRLRRWLGACETLARRLLLIEALAIAPAHGAHRESGGAFGMHGRPGFACEDSALWGVAFRALPPARRPRRESAFRLLRPPPPFNAQPLAERLEALIRVLSDPAPYARRLARKLHAAPHRAGAFTRATAGARAAPAARTALRETVPLAFLAAAAFGDTS